MKSFRSPFRRGRKTAFTLAEVMVVMVLLASAASIAAPSFVRAAKRNRGITCGQNLRNIQAAKSAALADNPNATLTQSLVASYLPNGIIPTCPAGGSYSGLNDATVLVSCSLNGDANADPQGNSGTDVTMNGQHDPFNPGGQMTPSSMGNSGGGILLPGGPTNTGPIRIIQAN